MDSEKQHSKILIIVNIIRLINWCREDVNSGHLVDTISLELEQLLQEVTIVTTLLLL